ncbi:MAG TPA: HRDC domain-containing protein [Anaerolineales bacterium]|nr:HRDC domain-containing protein [Anaerolineales bacterium]
MTNSISPPVWVDTNQSLRRMLSDMTTHPRLAVDTESNSLHAYRERVCLIQFSTPRSDYVVDPLALTDLSSLAPIFKNSQIEKIFHAAEYDLICLRRDFGFEFVNIFDTMHAARILGYSFVGLDNLLAEKLQVKVDKRHQKADWGARPLTPAQIDYARHDTHYLFALRDLLEAELRERGRFELALEDFARSCRLEESKEKLNGSTWRRFSGRKDVSLRELTILAELCQRRDLIAERLDRPPFKVIDDNLLLAIARNSPEKDVDLAVLGLSPRQIRLWGGEILAAFKRGTQAPLLNRDQPKRPSDAVLKRLDKLKNWRKKLAQEMKVESDVILPKTYLNMFAETPPKSLVDLEAIMADSPWRAKTYGTEILTLLGG